MITLCDVNGDEVKKYFVNLKIFFITASPEIKKNYKNQKYTKI